jgi:AcrR family transcriptional regulator
MAQDTPPQERLRYDGRGLPRGRSRLPTSDVEAAHVDRLTNAAIEVVARKGYDATAVADIVAAARVSRAAFYRHFGSKEECFLAACLKGLELLLAAIGKRVIAAPVDPPEEMLRATIGGFLDFLADEQAFARCFFLEMPAAGPEARRRVFKVLDLLGENTRHWHEHVIANTGRGQLLAPDVYRALAGGSAYLCYAGIHAGEIGSLPELLEPIMATHLAVLLGRPAAGS